MEHKKIYYYPDQGSFLNAVDATVIETDVALDIGCGIVPMAYYRPKLHIMAEPWEEYSDVLQQRHADDKSVIILRLGALETLAAFKDHSVDSIFLLDVIEHLEKEDGAKIVLEIKRVARQQAVIFTPLGFMAQHMEAGEPDAWGLSGGEMQEHKSGWLPEDFDQDWEFHVCETYHQTNFRGEKLEKAHGAFFAIYNCKEQTFKVESKINDIRRPLPSEILLQRSENEVQYLKSKLHELESKIGVSGSTGNEFKSAVNKWEAEINAGRVERQNLRNEIEAMNNRKAIKLANSIHRLLNSFRN